MGLKPGEWLEDAMRNGLIEPSQLSRPVATPPTLLAPSVAIVAKKPTPVETQAKRRLVIEFDIPVRTASEANARGKRKAEIARKSAVKAIAKSCLPRLAEPFPLPCRVTMTRHGIKKLDEDNLGRALKSVRDCLADWLGVDDGDEGRRGKVVWRCRQVAGWEPLVRVRVESVT
jgi:hypothetical protein